MKSQSVTAPSLTKKRYTFFTDVRRNRFSYLLILPALLYVLVFSYLSYPYMIIAFKNFNYKLGVFGSEWCGFKNFEFFLKSTNAPTVIRNTLVLNLLFIVTGTLTSLVLAILLNELRSRVFVRTAQTMMLFPHYISWVVVSYILLAIFSNKNGLANQLLNALGMKSVSWYTKADVWPTILVWMKIWKSAGMNAVIYRAAITGIDESIYESATIDGANRFQRIVSITVPADYAHRVHHDASGRGQDHERRLWHDLRAGGRSGHPVRDHRRDRHLRLPGAAPDGRPQPVHGHRPVSVPDRAGDGGGQQLDCQAHLPRRRAILRKEALP